MHMPKSLPGKNKCYKSMIMSSKASVLTCRISIRLPLTMYVLLGFSFGVNPDNTHNRNLNREASTVVIPSLYTIIVGHQRNKQEFSTPTPT